MDLTTAYVINMRYYKGKHSVDGYYAILYKNTFDRFHKVNPIMYGELWEVENSNFKRQNTITFNYIGKRVDKYGIIGIVTEFTRLYKTRRDYRIVRIDVIKDEFPEDFV